MANKNDDLSDTLSYKIGYGIAWVIGWLAGVIVKTMFAGIVTASQACTPLIFIYLGLVISAMISCALIGNCIAVILVIVLVAIIAGIWIRQKEAPHRDRVKFFNNVFETLNFKSNNGLFPIFEFEENISEYATAFNFRTFIPLTEWKAKKDVFEMYFNTKIVNIMQDKNDNRLIAIVVEDKALPNTIEWQDKYVCMEDDVFMMGFTHYGILGIDLNQNAHIFIAGETGSGKSNLLKCFIYQAIIKDYETVLIDFKRGVSFSIFGELIDICYEYETAEQILRELVEETKRRLDLFREQKVENITQYNKLKFAKLKRKIIFIDELAELLTCSDKEIAKSIYSSIETLTRIARAAGINLIMGIQRPDSKVITGQIKSNVSYRICFHFADKEPSRIMLGNDMASTISDTKGRCVIKSSEYYEVQSFYFPQRESEENKPLQEQYPNTETNSDENTANDLDFDFSDITKQ